MKQDKKKKNNVWKVIVAVLLVAALGVGGFFALRNYEPYNQQSIQKDPAAQIEKSLAKTEEALKAGAAIPLSEAPANALKTGKLTLSLVGEDKTALTGDLFLREDAFVLTGTATAPEQEALDGGIWVTKDAFVVSIPGEESNLAYGVNPTTLKDDLKNSALLEAMGITYEEAVEYLEAAMKMDPQKAEEEDSDWKTLLETKAKLEALLKSCSVTVVEGNLPLNNESVPSYLVSYTISPKQLCEALDLLSNWYSSTESYNASIKGDEELEKQYKESFEEAKKAITDMNCTAIVDFYLHQETQVIVQAQCKLNWKVEEYPASATMTLSFGADPVTSVLYRAQITTDLPEEGIQTAYAEYHRTHAHNLPGRMLTVHNEDGDTTLFELQYNTLNGNFEINMMDREYTVTGNYKADETTASLSVNLEETGILTVGFTKEAQLPATPEYKNLCKLSADELQKLFGAIAPEEPEYPEYPEEPGENWESGITVIAGESFAFYGLSHEYQTVGDLLVGEGIAILDENGRIASLCDEDMNSDSWTVIVNGTQEDGNLYEVSAAGSTEIQING